MHNMTPHHPTCHQLHEFSSFSAGDVWEDAAHVTLHESGEHAYQKACGLEKYKNSSGREQTCRKRRRDGVNKAQTAADIEASAPR
jgi:hypothetical protein